MGGWIIALRLDESQPGGWMNSPRRLSDDGQVCGGPSWSVAAEPGRVHTGGVQWCAFWVPLLRAV